ncbi:pyridoxal phosphate-dependent aminotransferase [Prosthecomicrobium sp. N25]|uniref:pyridoxal phosphate-dependent aminotransferase n=1 Tax=Prosthecomicrobium sp. N25 TaxID=3129254 RepID=UPI003077BC04
MPVPRPDDPFAFSGIRPQIRDLKTENIALLAVRAQSIPDVIPLWYGEGDIVTPAFIREAAKAAMDAGKTFYEPNMRGAAGLVAALSEYQTRLYGRPIAPSRSTVMPGGMQAVFMALSLVAEPGANVVFVEPQWPNIAAAIHLVGAEPRPVALGFDTDWRLDLDRLFAACDARTKAIMFSSPSNPCGFTVTREEMKALLDFSRRTGIWIISDEVYGRLWFEAEAAPSILEFAEEDDRVMAVNSFSKAWAMTGWRIGWLTHPVSVAPQLAAMTQYVNSGVSPFVQAGAEVAIREGEPFVQEVKARIRTGLDIAYDRLGRLNSVELPDKPRGGMYAFFRLKGEPDSAAACMRILEEAHVGLAPGNLFGAVGRPFIRMCVFRDPAVVEVAVDRIAGALG